MTPLELMWVGIAVFVMLLIGLGLTVKEFRDLR